MINEAQSKQKTIDRAAIYLYPLTIFNESGSPQVRVHGLLAMVFQESFCQKLDLISPCAQTLRYKCSKQARSVVREEATRNLRKKNGSFICSSVPRKGSEAVGFEGGRRAGTQSFRSIPYLPGRMKASSAVPCSLIYTAPFSFMMEKISGHSPTIATSLSSLIRYLTPRKAGWW